MVPHSGGAIITPHKQTLISPAHSLEWTALSTWSIKAGVERLGHGRRHRAADHGRTADRSEILPWVGGLSPMRSAVVFAIMLAEKGADALGAEVCDAVLAGPRKDDRVGEDDFLLVDATLDIAQDVVAAGDVVAKVYELS